MLWDASSPSLAPFFLGSSFLFILFFAPLTILPSAHCHACDTMPPPAPFPVPFWDTTKCGSIHAPSAHCCACDMMMPAGCIPTSCSLCVVVCVRVDDAGSPPCSSCCVVQLLICHACNTTPLVTPHLIPPLRVVVCQTQCCWPFLTSFRDMSCNPLCVSSSVQDNATGHLPPCLVPPLCVRHDAADHSLPHSRTCCPLPHSVRCRVCDTTPLPHSPALF
jgi:hypothetical protein